MQTNVQPGELVFQAMVNLEGKEGHLVKLAGPNAKPAVKLPEAATDLVQFVLTDCNYGIGAPASCLPLSPSYNVRVWLTGTCSIGDVLVLDPNDGEPTGKVTKKPTAAGNYRVVGIAEENGVDGQLIRMRPHCELVTVTE
jgi:hypothetical protein